MDKVAWQIAILFAGSALGGHYLGGYEWLRFFTYFGSWGTIGIVLASLGIGWLNLQLLGFCHRHHIRSLYELYLRLFGEAFASSLSVITHLFLLGYVGVMLGQQSASLIAGLSPIWVLLLSLIVTISFLFKRWQWIFTGTGICLVAGLLFFGLLFLRQPHVPIPNLGYQMNGNWLIHAIFFLALHFLLTLAVLLPFAGRASQPQSLRLGLGVGTVAVSLFWLLGQAVLLSHWHDIHASLLPVKLISVQLLSGGELVFALLALIQGGVLSALLLYSLAHPVTERHQLQMAPLLLVMLLAVSLFAVLSIVLPWSVSVVASGATYYGLFLIVWFVWKRQT
ncbi:membrane protein [Brevibacillus agri]|uniref:membrane protein n=1 Tax=Brevibacillus agri TaxID=51101 RepID=UPI0004704F1E|nr:membrane protein [Brevibacillus agri]